MRNRSIIQEFIGCKDAMKDKNITSRMSELINETDKDHKERLFNICVKDKQMRPTKHCTGIDCEVIPRSDSDCEKEEITVGWFHTHPEPGEERLSSSDIMYGIDKHFSCVGFKKEGKNKVLCFDYPYSMDFRKFSGSEDIFSDIESILKKGIKRDCEKTLD